VNWRNYHDTGVLSVDVEAIMKGSRNAPRSFLIYPGDRIYVPQRLF